MLGELQRSFKNALLQDDSSVSNIILGDGLTSADRLATYRHHVFETLTQVLKSAYPVVCRLVNERFFAYAADQYIRRQPPTGPCLFEYGASFPHFLANFPPCRDLLYLPDVARLEWAMHVAWCAEDATPLNPERLRGLTSDELANLRLELDPSVSYLQSPWPIERIWHVNQSEADPNETVSLDSGRISYLETRRVADEVLFRSLEPGAFAWRSALAERRTFEDALMAGSAAVPEFNLTTAIQTLLVEGLAIDIIDSRTP